MYGEAALVRHATMHTIQKWNNYWDILCMLMVMLKESVQKEKCSVLLSVF